MKKQSSKAVILLNDAKRTLAVASSLEEVKDIRDKAESLRVYAKRAGESLDLQNQIAEIRIRGERRAGEILSEMAKNNGQLLRGTIMRPRENVPTLEDSCTPQF